MPGSMYPHISEISIAPDLPNLLILRSSTKSQIAQRNFIELLLAAPLQRLRPSKVSKPIADEICVAGVDQNGNLVDDVGHDAMEGFHPISGEEEVAVDVEVAGLVAVDFHTERVHDFRLIEVFGDVAKGFVA